MSAKFREDGRTVELGNPEKTLFPRPGLTKRDLAEYYERISETMLPHVRGRPVTMERYPDGIEADGFIQQEIPGHFPDWIARVTVDKEGGRTTHVVCDDRLTLVYLVDQACVTPHIWLSTVDDLHHPDRMVFDLDPPGAVDPRAVRSAARVVGELLESIGLGARLMTTGSKGFHVVAPLDGKAGFDEVRDLARRIGGVLARRHPDELTVEQRIGKRRGRVFVDYLRNAYGQSTVAPYAVRARPGAPVATPIDWSELSTTSPRSYETRNLFRRLAQKADPWSDDGLEGQSLEGVSEALDVLEPRE